MFGCVCSVRVKVPRDLYETALSFLDVSPAENVFGLFILFLISCAKKFERWSFLKEKSVGFPHLCPFFKSMCVFDFGENGDYLSWFTGVSTFQPWPVMMTVQMSFRLSLRDRLRESHCSFTSKWVTWGGPNIWLGCLLDSFFTVKVFQAIPTSKRCRTGWIVHLPWHRSVLEYPRWSWREGCLGFSTRRSCGLTRLQRSSRRWRCCHNFYFSRSKLIKFSGLLVVNRCGAQGSPCNCQ